MNRAAATMTVWLATFSLLVASNRGAESMAWAEEWKTAGEKPVELSDDWSFDQIALSARPSAAVASAALAPAESTIWTARVDALLLWRNAPESRPLYDFWDPITSTPTGQALNASQFNSGMAAGPRFTILHETQDGYGWEIGYFRVQAFESMKELPYAFEGYANAEGTNIFGNAYAELDQVAGKLTSTIQSFEVLARLPSNDWLTWTAGFRWVEWRENLQLVDTYSYDPTDPSQTFFNAYKTSTINSLYGLQLGAEAAIWKPSASFRIDGVAKAGVYGNNAVQASESVTDDPYFPFSGNVTTSMARTAFVGEIGATATWQMTHHIAARAGYNAFWLGGLATAQNQLSGQTLAEGEQITGSTDTGGSVVLQGITLGLEGRW